MNEIVNLLPYITFFFLMFSTCSSLDSIAVFKNITDGETIVSGNKKFELGFFSPGSSKNRYLAIWYKNTSPHTALWIANRETPLINSLGMVKFGSQGILSLVNDGGIVIWSSNTSVSSNRVNLIARLLDNGNLVIKENNSVIWQSFDYLGDTFISGMKLGKDLITGREMYQTSWKSADDPSPGEYAIRFLMDKGKFPQVYIWKNSIIEARIGPFNGIEFAGQPNYKPDNQLYSVDIIVNQKEMYYVSTATSTTFSLRSVVTPNGKLEVSQLNMHNQVWRQDFIFPVDYCDNYGLCGPYGSCNTATFPNCVCLKGFELKNQQELSSDNWKSGCERSKDLDCGLGEGFVKFSSMKLPDTQNAVYNDSMSLQECEIACKNKCSCTAFANPNMSAGSVGCLLWFGDLIDIRVYPLNGQDLYVRLAASELFEGNTFSQWSFNKKKGVVTVVLSTSSVVILLVAVCACIKKKKRSRMKGRGKWYASHKKNTRPQMEDVDELPFFSLEEIAKATDNFCWDMSTS